MANYRDLKQGPDTISTSSIQDGTIETADIKDLNITDGKIFTISASKLTGALPAIDGSALTGISSGGYVSNTNGGFTRKVSVNGVETLTAWDLTPPGSAGDTGLCIINFSITIEKPENLSGLTTTLSGLGNAFSNGGQPYSNTLFGNTNLTNAQQGNRAHYQLTGEYTVGTNIVFVWSITKSGSPFTTLTGTYNAIFIR